MLEKVWESLVTAAGMFWQVGWSLVFGFLISAAVQTLVSNRRMRDLLGRDGLREIALATTFGAASSSCSYASAAVTRSMFAKGAALAPSLAFMFSSTNLVIELGIVLWILMGPAFTAAEWIGGLVLIAIMTLLVKLTYPRTLVERARETASRAAAGMDHDQTVTGATWLAKVRAPEFRVILAQHFAMDWEMLWVDLVAGFLIAGVLAVWVPQSVWHALAFGNAAPWLQVAGGAVVAPLIAIFTFVCSIGNVPMAAVLWGGGMSFSGVLAFLYADLIVLPLLDVYRKYYGLGMAAYIGALFYVTMVASGIIVSLAFSALHLVPPPVHTTFATFARFSFDATFWLNVVFAGVAVWLVSVNRRHPMAHGHCSAGHDEPDPGPAPHRAR